MVSWEQALAQLVGTTPRIERRVADLDLPVEVWQELLVAAAAGEGLDVRTYVTSPVPGSSHDDHEQLVVVVLLGRLPATDSPPVRARREWA